jgi:hypothetical protein
VGACRDQRDTLIGPVGARPVDLHISLFYDVCEAAASSHPPAECEPENRTKPRILPEWAAKVNGGKGKWLDGARSYADVETWAWIPENAVSIDSLLPI